MPIKFLSGILMKIDKSEIKKILCIKPRGIGDIILSTIILENLIHYYNDVQIDFLTEDFAVTAVENNPFVHKILSMKKKEFPLKVAARIRKEKYNLVFDLWSNPRSAQITFLSGIKFRAGFAYRGRKYAYNILASSGRGNYHSAEHNLELLKALEIPILSKKIHFYVSEKDDELAKQFLEKIIGTEKKIVGIIPSGGWKSKRCDAFKWVEICKAIAQKYNITFLILWGPDDKEDAAFIKNELGNNALLSPPTTISEMAGFINNCNLVIANDSGPMHISAAIGIPTLGLFGPTNPKMHGPYSDNSDYVIKEDLFCIICNKMQCPYKHECFTELSTHLVLSKVDQLIQKNHLNFPQS
jgi:lipopolysaccharide heptosyltransferase II